MKKITTTLFITIISTFAYNQSLSGKKVMSIGIDELTLYSNSFKGESSTATNSNSSFSIGLSPIITFGKVNSTNSLWSYGLGLRYFYSTAKNNQTGISNSSNTFSIMPTINYAKFHKIVDKVYYSFNASLNASYTKSKITNSEENNSDYGSNLIAYPLAISYLYKNKYNLLLKVGMAKLSYLYKYSSNAGGNPNLTNKSEDLTLSFYPSSLNFGIQIFY